MISGYTSSGGTCQLQVMSVWCEGRKEDWFCTHMGGGPLGQLQPLHLYFTFLFQSVYLRLLHIEWWNLPTDGTSLSLGCWPPCWVQGNWLGMPHSACQNWQIKIIRRLLLRAVVLDSGGSALGPLLDGLLGVLYCPAGRPLSSTMSAVAMCVLCPPGQVLVSA